MNKLKTYFSNKIYFINMFLALLILMLHSYNIDNMQVDSTDVSYAFPVVFEQLVRMFSQVAVPTFFMISAFLFYRTYEKRKYLEKLKVRVKSVLLPFLCYNLLFYLFFVLCTHINFVKEKMNMSTVPLDIATCIKAIWNSTFSPLWFLRNLFFYVLIAPLIYRVSSKVKTAVISIVFVLFCSLAIEVGYTNPLYFLPQYMFGALLGCRFKELIEKRRFTAKLAIWCLIILSTITFVGVSLYGHYNYMYFFRLFSPILFWIAIDCLEESVKSITFEPWYLRISFFIYCIHFPLTSIVGKLFELVLGNDPVSIFVSYLGTVLTVLIIIYALAFGIRKVSMPLWNLLNGGRA